MVCTSLSDCLTRFVTRAQAHQEAAQLKRDIMSLRQREKDYERCGPSGHMMWGGKGEKEVLKEVRVVG